MSYYYREVPRFADRLRNKTSNELLKEIKQHFHGDDDDDAFFESAGRPPRDSFERHASGFPRGFPFDEDEDSSDGIRAHLDDLASRHSEFAEHLLGPPWGNAPFHGSLLRGRRRRRGSGTGGQGYQGHQVDEDARSQASSSSAASGTSAASGASAVSSHSSEADSSIPTSIPQYGLRNTVDIGQQQRRDMENLEKGERGQRSMSAPPENQQPPRQQQQQSRQQQSPNQRFVSRVDITPQHNQQQQQQPRGQSPKPPSSSNVRHIPIFVEGRDEPVMPKVPDDSPPPSFQRQPSPPHFHRPSHFNEHFTRQQWPPQFQNAFYDSGFEPMRRQQKFQPQQHPQYFNQQNQHPQQHQQQPHYQQQHYQQQQPPQQQPPQQQPPQQQPPQPQQQQQQEVSKPKPLVPKDPLERVAIIQKEVDNLAEQVQRYVGGSRQDKEYVYLDEMLTRELIKLDDIETEGRENVRQARKNAIKSIQDTISFLEKKAPIVGQQEQSCERQESTEKDQRENVSQTEPMEIDSKEEKQINEPIPLPPAPSLPTKTKADSSEKESNTATTNEFTNQSATPAKQQNNEQTEMIVEQKTEENCATENMEVAAIPMSMGEPKHTEATTEEDTSKSNVGKEVEADNATQTTEKNDATVAIIAEEIKEGEKMEVDRQRTESPSLQKKMKKTKKQQQLQQPVSEQAIPLPPPSATDSAK